jgi:hypothetical protein
MYFEIVGEITNIEIIARGRGIRDLPRLNMTTTHIRRYALCLKNKNAEDLVVRKLYPIIPDARGEKDHHIRIVDESGEDYLDPAGFFFVMELPEKIDRALRHGHPRNIQGKRIARINEKGRSETGPYEAWAEHRNQPMPDPKTG